MKGCCQVVSTDAQIANGLKPLSLAQFYDPTGKNFRVIHIQAAVMPKES